MKDQGQLQRLGAAMLAAAESDAELMRAIKRRDDGALCAWANAPSAVRAWRESLGAVDLYLIALDAIIVDELWRGLIAAAGTPLPLTAAFRARLSELDSNGLAAAHYTRAASNGEAAAGGEQEGEALVLAFIGAVAPGACLRALALNGFA